MPTRSEWIAGITKDGKLLPAKRVNGYRKLYGKGDPLPLPSLTGSQPLSQNATAVRAPIAPPPVTEPELIAQQKIRTTTGIQDLHADAKWRSCRHRGVKLRDMQNCGCSGMDRGIYQCALGGECVKQLATARQREGYKAAGIKICDECEVADRPEPPLPSLAQRAVNYTAAATQHLLSGSPMATQEQIIARLAICEACPLYRFTDKACSVCGCPSNSSTDEANKLAWSDSVCPDPQGARWLAIESEPNGGSSLIRGGQPLKRAE